MRTISLSFAISSLLLSACASRPEIPREEFVKRTQRSYHGISQERIITAARQVLQLADGDDVKFTDLQDGFNADRSWFVFYGLGVSAGNEHWYVRLAQDGGATTMTTLVTQEQRGAVFIPIAVAPGITQVVPSGSSGPSGVPIDGLELYDIFYGRLDYLLGLAATWPDCKQIQKLRDRVTAAAEKQRPRTKPTFDDISPLCGTTVADNEPPVRSPQEASGAVLPAGAAPVQPEAPKTQGRRS